MTSPFCCLEWSLFTSCTFSYELLIGVDDLEATKDLLSSSSIFFNFWNLDSISFNFFFFCSSSLSLHHSLFRYSHHLSFSFYNICALSQSSSTSALLISSPRPESDSHSSSLFLNSPISPSSISE